MNPATASVNVTAHGAQANRDSGTKRASVDPSSALTPAAPVVADPPGGDPLRPPPAEPLERSLAVQTPERSSRARRGVDL